MSATPRAPRRARVSAMAPRLASSAATTLYPSRRGACRQRVRRASPGAGHVTTPSPDRTSPGHARPIPTSGSRVQLPAHPVDHCRRDVHHLLDRRHPEVSYADLADVLGRREADGDGIQFRMHGDRVVERSGCRSGRPADPVGLVGLRLRHKCRLGQFRHEAAIVDRLRPVSLSAGRAKTSRPRERDPGATEGCGGVRRSRSCRGLPTSLARPAHLPYLSSEGPSLATLC